MKSMLGKFAALAFSALLFSVNPRAIYRRAAAGLVHFVEISTGQLLIRPNPSRSMKERPAKRGFCPA